MIRYFYGAEGILPSLYKDMQNNKEKES
jgi:hypothetical protein